MTRYAKIQQIIEDANHPAALRDQASSALLIAIGFTLACGLASLADTFYAYFAFGGL